MYDYQCVFVLATGQPIKFPTYYTKKSFVKNHLPEIGLKNQKQLRTSLNNVLSYFLGISNCLAHDDDDDNDDKNHGKIYENFKKILGTFLESLKASTTQDLVRIASARGLPVLHCLVGDAY